MLLANGVQVGYEGEVAMVPAEHLITEHSRNRSVAMRSKKTVNWQVSMCHPAKPQVVAGNVHVHAHHPPGRGESQNRPARLDIAHTGGFLSSCETTNMARPGSVTHPISRGARETACFRELDLLMQVTH